MYKNLWQVLINSAEGSFIQVTVFVGIVLLLFGYIDFKQQGAFIETIEKSKRYQPIIGGLLGIIPGCGGSILLMPLYLKGTVTFGTIIATLIATAGDSAFVTLTQAPKDFIYVSLLCLFVGSITGYIVDYYKVGEWVRKRSPREGVNNIEEYHEKAEALLNGVYGDDSPPCRSCNLRHIGHEEGDQVDLLLHHADPLDTNKLNYKITHNCYIIFWLVIAIGFVFGVLELTQYDINSIPNLPNAGIIIGIIGTIVTLMYMFCSKRLLQAQSHEDVEHKLFSLRETFIHNAQETAFVGTWVFFAYLAYELGVYFAGGEEIIIRLISSTGLASVILGVLLGIIPGCGPQVIFVSLYLKGMFPFAALLGNAISQDGDALFPLIAMDRKAAFWATVINTIVAMIIGLAAYFIEMNLMS